MRAVVANLIFFTLGLASCGGGGGIDSPDWNPPASTSFRVSAQAIKTLVLRWESVPSATHYRLFEDLDGEAGPQTGAPIAEPLAGQQSFTLDDVFLPARVNARYRLQACNGTRCEDVAQAGIEGIDGGIGYFKASNPAARDEFGEGLALSADGQLLAVGAHLEDGLNEGINSVPNRGTETTNVGAVYMFHRGAAGWVQEAYIKPAKALPGARFGARLALARHGGGYTLLVGSPEDASGGSGVGASPETTPAIARSGAAYVFERNAQGAWAQTDYIKSQASVADGDAWFGSAVSLSADGQWAAVGQPYTQGGGSVLLYRREASGWVFRQALRGSNTKIGDGFGISLQLDAEGSTLVVGAWGEDGSTSMAGADNGSIDSGAVYVFKRDGNNPWPAQESAYLKASQIRVGGRFGVQVALSSGDATLVVGEPTDNSGANAGRVHAFKQRGTAWTHETFFASPTSQANGYFGNPLALSADGSTLVIANAGESSRGAGLMEPPVIDPAYPSTGSVFLYRRTATGEWSPPRPIKATNNRSDLYFGWSLALSADGGTLAAYGSDHSISSGIGGDPTDSSAHWAGAVYLY